MHLVLPPRRMHGANIKVVSLAGFLLRLLEKFLVLIARRLVSARRPQRECVPRRRAWEEGRENELESEKQNRNEPTQQHCESYSR